MYNIVLRPLLHRGQECIAVVAPLVRRLDLAIRQLRGVKWSHSNKVWYLPLSRESHGIILAALQSLATIAQGPLPTCLQKRKKVAASSPTARGTQARRLAFQKAPLQTTAWRLSPKT
ncbi:MAG TPA: hypothetical protein VF609_02295 [Flavisolibacter sp.]